jgi:hypothetical protein
MPGLVNNVPLINGRAYDYASIVINVLGVPLMGVKSIEYKVEQEKTNNYGAGNLPVSRGHGVKKADATLELSMDDVEVLRNALPTRNLLDVPAFPITVSFLNGAKTVTHVLHNCEFLDDGVTGAVDDTELARSFPLVVSHITF